MPRRIAIASRPTKFDRFKLALVESPEKSPTAIAFEIYDCKNKNVAAVVASENLRKLNIKMPELMDRLGISDEKIIKKLDSLISAKKVTRMVCDKQIEEFTDDDGDLQLASTQLAFRLKGHLKESKNGNGHTINIMGDVTVQQLKSMPYDELIRTITTKLSEANRS